MSLKHSFDLFWNLHLFSYIIKFYPFFPQLVLSVHDSAFPNNVATETLTVNVDRNPNSPNCRSAIDKELDIDMKLNDVVDVLRATDPEGVCKI